MAKRYSPSGKPLYGSHGSAGFYHRPARAVEKISHIPGKQFCKQHEISRWVAYRAHQDLKLISGIRRSGQWHYAIIPGCEQQFEGYLAKTKKMHKPRLGKRNPTGKTDYDLGFQENHLRVTVAITPV